MSTKCTSLTLHITNFRLLIDCFNDSAQQPMLLLKNGIKYITVKKHCIQGHFCAAWRPLPSSTKGTRTVTEQRDSYFPSPPPPSSNTIFLLADLRLSGLQTLESTMLSVLLVREGVLLGPSQPASQHVCFQHFSSIQISENSRTPAYFPQMHTRSVPI